MPTTDIPLKARAAATASRCGSPLRALRLLREAKERTHSLSEKSRAGRQNCGGGAARLSRAASARPAASSPLRFAAPNRQLLRSAPARSAPGGASHRSAEARRPRPRPAAPVSARQRLAAEWQVRERAGKREGRPRSRGQGGAGRQSRDARGSEAVSRQHQGSRGLQTLS